MPDEMIQTLSTYISKEIQKKPGRTIQPDEAILSSGMIDSFHLVDLGMFVEDTYGVRIEDFELNVDTFDTIGQLAALIRSRQA